jgi:hypothetical protein
VSLLYHNLYISVKSYEAPIDVSIVTGFIFQLVDMMSDLPCTSAQHAREAERAARDAGLTRIRIGGRHLLDAGWG